MKKAFALLPLAAAILAGCNSASTDATTTASSSSSTNAAPSTKPAETAAKDPQTTTGDTAASTPALSETPVASNQTVPSELKHEGYEYEGLANGKPVDMEIKITGATAQDLTGSQTITLTGVKDGAATYSVTRTGGLETLGSESWILKKDGVYDAHSSKMSFDAATLDLPADPKPGKSWPIHVKADDPTAKMDLTMTTTIVGKESVKTAAGTFKDALMVTQTGGGTEQGQKVRTTGKQWYVKGIGVVKSVLTMNLPNNQVSNISIEVTHR